MADFGFLFIISRQKDKSQKACNNVMKYSFIFEASFYFLIGFLGYFALSKKCTAIDFTYITRDDGWGSDHEDYGLLVAKMIYIIALLCVISVRIELIEEIIKHFFEDKEKFARLENIWKCGTIFVTGILSTIVILINNDPNVETNLMNNVTEIFNAIVGVAISFYIPLFVFHSIYGRRRTRSKIGYGCFIIFSLISVGSIISNIYYMVFTINKHKQEEKDGYKIFK